METESIDLRKLWYILRKRLWIIALSAVLCVGLSGIYTFYFVSEQYTADVLLYIWESKNGESTDALNSSDLNLFSQLVGDYQVLATSRLVTSQVAEELGLSEAQAGRLSSKISIGTKSNTRHLTITVKDTDPTMAANIANKVAEVFSRVVIEKMGVGNVNIIDQAIVPKSPSSPNKPMNLALGLLIGLVLGVGLALLVDFLDTSVKSADDVQALTGFSLLGTIPEYEKDQQIMMARRNNRRG
ncbi:MAG: Wzz/FepE/Etk N-terminal domain-containing protein [Clostridiaceae bacterium]|nr:Wzz/FepE/Etk N-terminal domain-containing protein [Clostridiaceae bacterium]